MVVSPVNAQNQKYSLIIDSFAGFEDDTFCDAPEPTPQDSGASSISVTDLLSSMILKGLSEVSVQLVAAYEVGAVAVQLGLAQLVVRYVGLVVVQALVAQLVPLQLLISAEGVQLVGMALGAEPASRPQLWLVMYESLAKLLVSQVLVQSNPRQLGDVIGAIGLEILQDVGSVMQVLGSTNADPVVIGWMDGNADSQVEVVVVIYVCLRLSLSIFVSSVIEAVIVYPPRFSQQLIATISLTAEVWTAGFSSNTQAKQMDIWSCSQQNISESSNFQQFPYEVTCNPIIELSSPNTIYVGIMAVNSSFIPWFRSMDLRMWIIIWSMMGQELTILQMFTLGDTSSRWKNSANSFLNWKSLQTSRMFSESWVNRISNSGQKTSRLKVVANSLPALFSVLISNPSLNSWKQNILIFEWGSLRNYLITRLSLTKFSLKNQGQLLASGNRLAVGGSVRQLASEIPGALRMSSQALSSKAPQDI